MTTPRMDPRGALTAGALLSLSEAAAAAIAPLLAKSADLARVALSALHPGVLEAAERFGGRDE